MEAVSRTDSDGDNDGNVSDLVFEDEESVQPYIIYLCTGGDDEFFSTEVEGAVGRFVGTVAAFSFDSQTS